MYTLVSSTRKFSNTNSFVLALVKRVVRQIPRSLPYYENTGSHNVEDETDPVVCELMKIRPHKPQFTILSQLNDETVPSYSSKLLELLYLLLEEKQLDDHIRMDLERSLSNLISFIPWVVPDIVENLEIDTKVSYKNRQSIPKPKRDSAGPGAKYPDGYLSKILIDNFDTLIKFSSTYFNLTLSTLVTKYIVELIYQLYYWEVVHLAHTNPKVIDFLELIGFEITQTTFGPIIKPPENYLNDNLLQGLQYPFPYPFYNYSYHAFNSKVEDKKFDRVHIEPYMDITLKNVDPVPRKKRKGSGRTPEDTRVSSPNLPRARIGSNASAQTVGSDWSNQAKTKVEQGKRGKEEEQLAHGHTPVQSPPMAISQSSVSASVPHQSPVYPQQSPYLPNNPPQGISPVPYNHYSFQSLPPPTPQLPQQLHSQQFSTSPPLQLQLPPFHFQHPQHTQSTPTLMTKGNQVSSSSLDQQRELPSIAPISNYTSSQDNLLPSITKLTDRRDHNVSEALSCQGTSVQSTGLGITAPIGAQTSPLTGIPPQPISLFPSFEDNDRKLSGDVHYNARSPFQPGQTSQAPLFPGSEAVVGSEGYLVPTDKNKKGSRYSVIHQCHLTDPATNTKCLKIFYGKNELLRHQEFVHATKKRIYKCLYCERSGLSVQSYPRHDSLARHIRRKHGITGKENKMAVNYAKENVVILDDAEGANIEYGPEEGYSKQPVAEPVDSLGTLEARARRKEMLEYQEFKQNVEQDLRERRGKPNLPFSEPGPEGGRRPIPLPTQAAPSFKKPLLSTGASTYPHGSPSDIRASSFPSVLQDTSTMHVVPNNATHRLFSIYMGPNSIPSEYTQREMQRTGTELPHTDNTNQLSNEFNGGALDSASRNSSESRRSGVKLPLIHDIDNEIGHAYRG